MKRIFSFLFAILFAVGTTGVFTSCQEDAPEITINITMNNDFSDVVNAINNGTLKQEAAIAALTAAIEKMQGDQDSKLQAIADAINSLASTLDAKLAIIEAAMKAQTLALETKLDLLEAAIKALPNYTDQLQAIEAAIAALPNYGDQLGAIAAAIEALPDYTEQMGALETALKTIADNIEAQEGQYADELAALKTSIDAIKSEVAAGNKSQEDALAEIITLLESGALAGGGGGSGSGGEGSGGDSENETSYIEIKSSVLQTGFEVHVKWSESQEISYDLIEGLDPVTISPVTSGEFNGTYEVRGKMSSLGESTAEVKIKGDITEFLCMGRHLTKIDVSNAPNLIELQLQNNELKSLDVSKNVKLETLYCDENQLTSLDVSKNVKLEMLLCGENQLTSLDVSKNVNLIHLGCSQNKLTSLLVSNQVDGGFNGMYVDKNSLNEAAITALINSMPNTTKSDRNFYLKHSSDEGNVVTNTHINDAKKKGYKVFIHDGSDWVEK